MAYDQKVWEQAYADAKERFEDVIYDYADELAQSRTLEEGLKIQAQAFGLLTTAVPDMEIDTRNPMAMAQRIMAEIERLREGIVEYGRHLVTCASRLPFDASIGEKPEPCSCGLSALEESDGQG